jgi:hypothetical protein
MKNHFKLLQFGAALLCACVSTHAQIISTDYKAATVRGNNTSGVYDPTDTYKVGAQDWVANLLPANATYQRAVSDNFFKVLSAAFPVSAGWSYASAVNELSAASLVVHTYDVTGQPDLVGAAFHVEYVPHGTDPTANMHWIQVVTDNHNLTTNKGHGNPENVVDNPFSAGGASPYYDDGGAADSRNFYDFSFRDDGNQSHIWQAELFLVSGPAIGTKGPITFYGGIIWGWENHPVPEPSTAAYAVGFLVLVLVSVTRSRRARRTS